MKTGSAGATTPIFTETKVGWIPGCYDRNTPFFAYIATNAPHEPPVSAHTLPEARPKGICRDQDSLSAMLTGIDEHSARLERFLLAHEDATTRTSPVRPIKWPLVWR